MPVNNLKNLPTLPKPKLPAAYETARVALEKCSRIDECADWANKSEALSSYAKQAKDDTLRKMADRIQARAIRRCGELLKQVKPSVGGQPTHRGGSTSRSKAARDAGLSKDQKVTALRVVNIPKDEFESAIESSEPPTITELAKRGTDVSKSTLRGPAPKFIISSWESLRLQISDQVRDTLGCKKFTLEQRRKIWTKDIKPMLRVLNRLLVK